MATRKQVRSKSGDFRSWNFILFLTLAFILMVILLGAIGQTTNDLRSRAGLACATPTLPPAAGCPGGWKYTTNANSHCPMFICETK